MSEQATLTEFLRSPKNVISKADNGVVRITRRGGDDLVMLRASDLDHQQEGVSIASDVMRATLRTQSVKAALVEQFGWTSELSEPELDQFAAEVEKQLWASSSLGRYTQFLMTFRSWQETASAYAAGLPRGDGRGLEWLDRPIAATRP